METSILYNYPIAAMLAAWFIAQAAKLVSYGIRERRFDYGFMFRLGGMPSSHSASAASCTLLESPLQPCPSEALPAHPRMSCRP